jgi:multidrug transporter EmrE-like cation transporter
VFASWLLLGEPLSVFQLGGLALVILGVSRLKPKALPALTATPERASS